MIYFLILVFLLFTVYHFDIREKTRGRKVTLFFVFVSFILLSTLRFRVGGDALFYEDVFPDMPDLKGYIFYIKYLNTLYYQPLWLLLVAVSKSIVNDMVFFQLIHSLIFNLAIYIFLRRYSLKPFTVLTILFVSLLYFYYSFEIQRESVAISIFMVNIKYLEEKKWLIYFPLAFLSFMFHISAIFLFFLPFLRYLKFNQKLLGFTLISTVFVYYFREQILDIIIRLLFMDVMKSKMEAYAGFKFSILGFWSFYFVRVFLLIPIMFFNLRNNLHNDRFRWFYPAFFIASVMAQHYVGFERLLNYMFPVYFVLIVDFFYKYYPLIESRIKKYVIVASIVLHVFFIMNYKLVMKNDFGQRYVSVFFPYTSLFDPETLPEREKYYENKWK